MQRTVETEVGALAVFESGSGPPVLLWPSLYMDHHSLDALVAHLSGERRCLVIDGPGHGASPGPAGDYDMRACARAGIQVLDAFGIDRVDWVGNAWGGHVGARAALDHPDRIQSLAAFASPLDPLSWSLRMKTRLLLVMLRLRLVGPIGAILAKVMLSPAAAPAATDEVRRAVREAPRAGLASAVRCISLRRKDLTPELHRIACPTLLIAGGDDAMYPPGMAAAQAARIPGARCETLAGTGHLGPLESPDAAAALLRAHWAAHRRAA